MSTLDKGYKIVTKTQYKTKQRIERPPSFKTQSQIANVFLDGNICYDLHCVLGSPGKELKISKSYTTRSW